VYTQTHTHMPSSGSPSLRTPLWDLLLVESTFLMPRSMNFSACMGLRDPPPTPNQDTGQSVTPRKFLPTPPPALGILWSALLALSSHQQCHMDGTVWSVTF
jgi:hypothetical protein